MAAPPSRRVLIVEDELQVSELLREMLVRNGYEVQQARNGAEAIVCLTEPGESPADLVILDINLPLESGVYVLELLREKLGSTIPVIVLTASATEEQDEELERLGISAYLRKPASTNVLLSEVERVLAQHGREG